MLMTLGEKRSHAIRIIREVVHDLDFCYVYEDEQLEDVDEETQADIHSMIVRAKVLTVAWNGGKS